MNPQLKEQDSRYHQQCKVVILDTSEKSTNAVISVRSDKPWVMMSEKHSPFGMKKYDSPELYHTYSNIYILSDDGIKEGDWVYLENNHVLQFKEPSNRHFYKKIIATTDETLGLPKPSDSFISKYIKEYNKGSQINDVVVEVDSNNTITIEKIKNSYSREEVIEILSKMRNYCKDEWKSDSLHRVFYDYNNWIKENL